jgi:hypothetical protein
MTGFTDSQEATLKRMLGYRVLLQLMSGELVVAPGNEYQLAKVIDLTGKILPYSVFYAIRYPVALTLSPEG